MTTNFGHSPRNTESATDAFHVRAFRSDDEIIVVADLPGVSVDELTVGFTHEDTDFALEVGNKYRARVLLPWDSVSHSQARFANGVFEIRIRRAKGNHTKTEESPPAS